MNKPKPSREAAKAFVSPLFAWSNAMLKGGEMMLDSMAAAAKQAGKAARVDVIPTADAPPRRARRPKKAQAARKSKARR